MTLDTLRDILKTVTDTEIGEVFFDWKKYLNETRSKEYPVVLFQLDGAKFKTDMRTSTVRETKIFTLTVYAIASFNPDTEDKINVWDTLEAQFKTYLNTLDSNDSLNIVNIDSIEGRYAGEGLLSADREIGIEYRDVQLKMWC